MKQEVKPVEHSLRLSEVETADEELFLKQEVKPVEHCLRLAQADDNEATLTLVEDKPVEDSPQEDPSKASIVALLKEMEIVEEVQEAEEQQTVEATPAPSKPEVKETAHQNDTIGLAANNPPAFRKNLNEESPRNAQVRLCFVSENNRRKKSDSSCFINYNWLWKRLAMKLPKLTILLLL